MLNAEEADQLRKGGYTTIYRPRDNGWFRHLEGQGYLACAHNKGRGFWSVLVTDLGRKKLAEYEEARRLAAETEATERYLAGAVF